MSAPITESEAEYHMRKEQELYDTVREIMGLGWEETSEFIKAVRAVIKAGNTEP